MGQLREHPGHRADALRRIAIAREHYETRASRRTRQTWTTTAAALEIAAAKGAKGAVPGRM